MERGDARYPRSIEPFESEPLNQHIQVIDGFDYIEEKSALKIQSIAGGALINCYVMGINCVDSEKVYQALQFDIEEKIIELIENEDFNSQGEIEISVSQL